MLPISRIQSLLNRADLTPAEIKLYLYVQENPGSLVSDASAKLAFGKSTLYRALEKLAELELIRSVKGKWEIRLYPNSLRGLIRSLENENRKNQRLISTLKAIDSNRALNPSSRISNIETLNMEDTFQRYIDLSEMKWDNMFVFGNWEDFNERKNIVDIEKQFINNRLKHGGHAFVVVTKEGSGTKQIVDYNHDLDRREDRISKKVELFGGEPVWINVFDGNNFVHLWNFNKNREICSTFIESAPLAEFYRRFISGLLVA